MTDSIQPSDVFAQIQQRMLNDKAPPLAIAAFVRQVEKWRQGQTGLISESLIAPPANLPSSTALADYARDGCSALRHTLLIKLNGGLGTTMGLESAKSLIPVKDGRSFLDIIAGQILQLRKTHDCPLPLLLMNSFSTQCGTQQALARYPELARGQTGIPLFFLQHRVPKLLPATGQPADWPEQPELEWCPPGHGDLYTALTTTGLLSQLRQQGYLYAFASNADNLGATLDMNILGWMARHNFPFLMEVTDRTEADRKGGHLAVRREGGLLLREIAQCPEEEIPIFQDIQRYPFFNTNNLWLNLQALQEKLEQTGSILDLPLIINRKTVDPRQAKSPPVIQLETAMGSAIALFPGAGALRVPRTRFAPVKTTSDLLALWSDAYTLTPEQHLRLADECSSPPVIDLDAAFYRTLDDLRKRFPQGAPSLKHCSSLNVQGDVRFGRNIICRGRVAVCNNSTTPLVLEDGRVLASA